MPEKVSCIYDKVVGQIRQFVRLGWWYPIAMWLLGRGNSLLLRGFVPSAEPLCTCPDTVYKMRQSVLKQALCLSTHMGDL